MGARVIENWADVTGLVLEKRAGQSAEFLELNLQVEAAQDVKGMANLVAPLVGKTLWVNIPCDLAQSLDVQVNDVVQARVRRISGELAFVHNEYVTVHRLRTAGEAPASTPSAQADEDELSEDIPSDVKHGSGATDVGSTTDADDDEITALVERGYRVYFCATDLAMEPPQVHVDKEHKEATFWLSPLNLADPGAFSRQECKQIEHILAQNLNELLAQWHTERAKAE